MRVSYYLAAGRPPDPGRDAVHREVEALRRRFPGPLAYFVPSAGLGRRLPARWRTRAAARLIRARDDASDLHHVWLDRLDWCPAFVAATKPVVCSLVTTFDPVTMTVPAGGPPSRTLLVVADDRSRTALEAVGVEVAAVVPAGCDLTRFAPRPAPPSPPFLLLAGSAPWTKRQFRSKGFDVLLELVAATPDLELVLLWRGALDAEIERRAAAPPVAGRVRVIHEHADVAALLATSHGAVVLASHSRQVKAFPHSLLEAVAAGRPVVVSGCLGISDWVRETGCGIVVDDLRLDTLRAAVDRLRHDSAPLAAGAAAAELGRFSDGALASSYASLYSRALSASRTDR